MEAGDLVRLPDPNAPALSPEKQQLALEWGGRHPYLLQLAGLWLWEARRKDRPVDWAKQKFDEQAEFLLQDEQAEFSRQKIFGSRRLWSLLKWLFLDFPTKVGSLGRLIGANWAELGDRIFGYIIIMSIVALAFGLASLDEIRNFLEQAFGG